MWRVTSKVVIRPKHCVSRRLSSGVNQKEKVVILGIVNE